ncbi:hypothetical protein B0H16DRAFT_1686008 [Mycena metata]|uniref:Uncharacterized protein n=1 Tax=Mycena metata TaxID=1033252 RepID=A0AAD7JQM2_9AGAR|nr:hypothetical protein B0H16DRAFT_1686008 [Mycena metata]
MNPTANVIKHPYRLHYTLRASYFPVGQSIYMFSRGSIVGDASVQHLPFSPHPSDLGATPNSMVPTVIPNRYSFASRQTEFRGMFSEIALHGSHVCSPRYGVFAGEAAEEDSLLRPGKWYYYEQRDRIKLDEEDYLGLLRFSTTPTPHTTFRKLDIGDAFERLGVVSQMALDEALGTIFLLDEEGNLLGGNGHGNGPSVTLPILRRVTVTVRAVASKKS